jgi:glyceraldehyde-3-phosphate dehydrogenase/erythrose-4-phosphate dehydrogenase
VIANPTELRLAIRNLRILETTLETIRSELKERNPWLLQITSKAYVRRIDSIQKDIVAYLADHPSEVSQILPPLEQAVAAVAPVAAPTT